MYLSFVIPLLDNAEIGTLANGSIEQSSQWDGFRHHSQARDTKESLTSQERVFYGGTSIEEIEDSSNHRIGLQHWAAEGIAGEFILVYWVHLQYGVPNIIRIPISRLFTCILLPRILRYHQTVQLLNIPRPRNPHRLRTLGIDSNPTNNLLHILHTLHPIVNAPSRPQVAECISPER